MNVSFLAVDSRGEHETGQARSWSNRVMLKHRIYQSGDDRRMELRAIPGGVIRYTTNGSSPKLAGAVYNSDFVIPHGAPLVLAYAEQDGIESEVQQIPISWEDDKGFEVDAQRPAVWRRSHGYNSTKESYEFLARLKKYNARASGLRITIAGEGGDKEWVELYTSEQKQVTPELVEACLEALRQMQTSGQVQLATESLHFEMGLDLQAWVEDAKLTLVSAEVKQ
jgi:hypothetical protein